MQHTSKFLLVTCFSLLLGSCGSTKTDKKEKEVRDTVTATQPIDTTSKPLEIKLVEDQKCFTNDGLQYAVVVKLYLGSSSFARGKIESRDLATDSVATVDFEGSFNGYGEKFSPRFKGTPPVIGNSSEWTDKPWIITDKRVTIIFNAKNHDTNKWTETPYQFELSGCKN